jgi:hypothetical protein
MKPSSSNNNHKKQGHHNAGSYQPPPAYNYQSIMSNNNRNLESPEVPPTATATPHTGVINNGSNLNLQSPSYQRVERVSVDKESQLRDPLSTKSSTTLHIRHKKESKTCRICLDDDSPETMIAPCKCRGSSKWVHRDCLDEWRLQESDRAFSKCTECLFDYYMQPVYQDEDGTIHRRIKFYWNVSRDVCLGTLVLQLIIMALAGLIYVCDPNQALPNQILPAFKAHPWSLYYLLGWLLLLIFGGIYGSVVLCFNECSFSKSIPQFPSPSNSTTPVTTLSSGGTTEQRMVRANGRDNTTTEFYRARHQRHRNYQHDQQRRENHNNNNNNNNTEYSCCYSCTNCCNRQPIVICDPSGCYCCYCCDDCGYPYNQSGQDSECCNGSHCGGGDSGGNQDCGECVHVLLIILLVFAIILAVIGFFVGIVITVVAFQRVVQRHIHLVQKKQLIQEYQVMDLQEYDLTRPLPTAPQEEDLEWNTRERSESKYSPSAVPISPLPAKDVSYLQNLGLKE